MTIALAALFFGCIGLLAVELSTALCKDVAPADDAPVAMRPPRAILVAGSAVLGGILIYQGCTPLQLGIAAIVIFALVACWCSDALCGLLPDVFTLGPLAALLVFALVQRDWEIVVSAFVMFLPFAIAAIFSRGRGMGWGDAKMVALTGAALGAPLGALALALACIAAVVIHRFSASRSSPIAFAPYIAAFTGVALPLGLTR